MRPLLKWSVHHLNAMTPFEGFRVRESRILRFLVLNAVAALLLGLLYLAAFVGRGMLKLPATALCFFVGGACGGLDIQFGEDICTTRGFHAWRPVILWLCLFSSEVFLAGKADAAVAAFQRYGELRLLSSYADWAYAFVVTMLLVVTVSYRAQSPLGRPGLFGQKNMTVLASACAIAIGIRMWIVSILHLKGISPTHILSELQSCLLWSFFAVALFTLIAAFSKRRRVAQVSDLP